MLRLEWIDDTQPDVRGILEELLAVAVLPSWLQQLYVAYDPEKGDEKASVSPELAYRRATLTFGSLLKYTEQDRQDTVVHEGVHVFLTPIEEVVERMIPLLPKEQRGLLRKLYDTAVEATTTDLTYAIRHLQHEVENAQP